MIPNHPELTIECSKEEWRYFLDSSNFTGLLCPVIKDTADARKLFEEVFESTRNTFASASQDVKKVINDDMNIHYDNLTPDCIIHAIKLLMAKSKETNNEIMLNVAMYLVIQENFEKKASDEKKYNLDDYVKKVKEFKSVDKMGILENYMKKY